MDILHHFISEELIYALGWTVMHSLWQGFLIAIALAFILQMFRKKTAQLRYETATFSLFLVLISAVCTFIWYYDSAGIPADMLSVEKILFEGATVVTTEATVLQSFTQSCIAYFNTHLPMIVLLWMIGVGFFILRLFGGLAYVQRLKYHRVHHLSAYWQDKVSTLAKKIPTPKIPVLVESASVKVPMVIGYVKPFILLPIGAINQLGAADIEAIIAHELAHISRNDFLINILLSFIEVLFYFHPAVWWISGNIRLERENCCDDIAIRVCGNSLTYAKALVRLQELEAYAPGFAMPFTGQKNQLLNRIKRILNQPQNKSAIVEKLTATCFLFLAIIFMSVSANQPEPKAPSNLTTLELSSIEAVAMEEETEQEEEVEVLGLLGKEIVDSLPGEEERILRGNLLEITRKDGELMEVVLDGKLIPKDEYEQYDHIETENGIRVYDDEVQLLGDVILYDTFPERKSKRIKVEGEGANTNSFFYRGKKEKKVTKKKNEKGQTVIIVETAGQEPVEIILEGEGNDVIIVEGNTLEDGDTAILQEEDKGFPFQFYQDRTNLILADSTFLDRSMSHKKWKELYPNAEQFGFRYRLDDEALNLPEVKEQFEAFKQEHRLKMEQDHEKLNLLREQLKERSTFLDERGRELELETREFYNKELLKQKEALHNFKLLYSGIEKEENKMVFTFAAELKRDGLIEDTEDFSMSLTKKKFKVNGKKQSKAFLKKYAKLYEKLSGNKLESKSSYQINISNY